MYLYLYERNFYQYTCTFISSNQFINASLHQSVFCYQKEINKDNVFKQIEILRRRLNMIRNMQALGVASFLSCITCMYFIFSNHMYTAHILFVISILCLVASLLISLAEIIISTKAVELELSDIEGLEKDSMLNMFKRD
jgi:hypothetical protein